MADDHLDDFTQESFSHGGTTKTVYRKGEGPAVIVMEEMPGITPNVAAFARRVVDLGCTVWMPHLFGDPGRSPTVPYTLRSIVPACVSREFAAFAKGRTSPVTDWLRALARHAHAECGGPGVGAIGMCWTGGFALGMAVDAELLAPVLSQPSLPFSLTRGHRADPGVSSGDLEQVRRRVEEDDLCVLGLRFTGDRLAPGERFASLRRELGDAFIGVEIDSSPGNPNGIRRLAHSVVTEDLVDEPGHPTHDALEQVLEFFRERLL